MSAFTKMLWVTDGYADVKSWNFWSSVSENIIAFVRKSDGVVSYIQKMNNKIAYYCVFKRPIGSDFLYVPLCISPDLNATEITGGTPSSSRYITDSNGINWYWTASSLVADSNLYNTPDCLLSSTLYPATIQGYEQAVRDLIDKIYNVPFHEDYQVGQSYRPYYCDKLKTIRKVAGTFLFEFISYYDTDNGYKNLSDNVDIIISYLMNNSSSHQWNTIRCEIASSYVSFSVCSCPVIISQMNIDTRANWNGFDYCKYRPTSIQFVGPRVNINRSTGQITYDTTSFTSSTCFVGIYFNIPPSTSTPSVYSETVGMDL